MLDLDRMRVDTGLTSTGWIDASVPTAVTLKGARFGTRTFDVPAGKHVLTVGAGR